MFMRGPRSSPKSEVSLGVRGFCFIASIRGTLLVWFGVFGLAGLLGLRACLSRSRSISCIRLRKRYRVCPHSSLRNELASIADLNVAFGVSYWSAWGAAFDGLWRWTEVGVARVRSIVVWARKFVWIFCCKVASRSLTLMFVLAPTSHSLAWFVAGVCTSVSLLPVRGYGRTVLCLPRPVRPRFETADCRRFREPPVSARVPGGPRFTSTGMLTVFA